MDELDSGVNAHWPSVPPPRQASLDVYVEQVDCLIQFTPFETHFIPAIELRQAELVVSMLSEHCFNLHTGASVELA